MRDGGRRSRLWLANNQHIFKQKPKMDNRILCIHHKRLDLRAFVKESLRGHKERSLITREAYMKKKLLEELAQQEQGVEVEVEDKYILSYYQMMDEL